MSTGDRRPEIGDRTTATGAWPEGGCGGRRVLVAVVVLALPTLAAAQAVGSMEVAGGYGFLGDSELVDGFGPGWFAEAGWRTTEWMSVIGEVGRHRRTQDVGFIDVEVTFQTLLAGPRFWVATPRITPFVHVLGGATRLDVVARTSTPMATTGDDAATYGTLQIGGGVEVPLADRFALRVGADYRRVFRSAGLDESRFSTGVVYRFGGAQP